jgi:hypothetical protein
MKNYDISAQEFIAWARICRPGSVLGPQQHFLVQVEATVKQLQTSMPAVTMSPEEKKIAKTGDFGQADKLISQKIQKQSTKLSHGSTSTRSSSHTPPLTDSHITEPETPEINKTGHASLKRLPNKTGPNRSNIFAQRSSVGPQTRKLRIY